MYYTIPIHLRRAGGGGRAAARGRQRAQACARRRWRCRAPRIRSRSGSGRARGGRGDSSARHQRSACSHWPASFGSLATTPRPACVATVMASCSDAAQGARATSQCERPKKRSMHRACGRKHLQQRSAAGSTCCGTRARGAAGRGSWSRGSSAWSRSASRAWSSRATASPQRARSRARCGC